MSESAEDREYARAAELVAKELQERLGECAPQPRLEPTPGADESLHNAELEAYIAAASRRRR